VIDFNEGCLIWLNYQEPGANAAYALAASVHLAFALFPGTIRR